MFTLIRSDKAAPSPASAQARRAKHSSACASAPCASAALPRAVTPEQNTSFAPPPSGTTRAGAKAGFCADWLIPDLPYQPFTRSQTATTSRPPSTTWYRSCAAAVRQEWFGATRSRAPTGRRWKGSGVGACTSPCSW